jgi:hypothetical protein
MSRKGIVRESVQIVSGDGSSDPADKTARTSASASSFATPLDALLSDDSVIGFVAGFGIAHEGHEWDFVGVEGSSAVFCWCSECREGKVYAPRVLPPPPPLFQGGGEKR